MTESLEERLVRAEERMEALRRKLAKLEAELAALEQARTPPPLGVSVAEQIKHQEKIG